MIDNKYLFIFKFKIRRASYRNNAVGRVRVAVAAGAVDTCVSMIDNIVLVFIISLVCTYISYF